VRTKKRIPTFRTDVEAESFVATADLSGYDLSDLTPIRFIFERTSAPRDGGLPTALLEAIRHHKPG
jgi:hypothetical protein